MRVGVLGRGREGNWKGQQSVDGQDSSVRGFVGREGDRVELGVGRLAWEKEMGVLG